jgi:hypothetical protein
VRHAIVGKYQDWKLCARAKAAGRIAFGVVRNRIFFTGEKMNSVTPAGAAGRIEGAEWIPAFAGMTVELKPSSPRRKPGPIE